MREYIALKEKESQRNTIFKLTYHDMSTSFVLSSAAAKKNNKEKIETCFQ